MADAPVLVNPSWTSWARDSELPSDHSSWASSGGSDSRGGDWGGPAGGGGNGPIGGQPIPPPIGPHMPVGRSEGLGSWQPYENYLYTRADTHGGRPQHSTIGSIGQGSNRWEDRQANQGSAPSDAEEASAGPQAVSGSNPLVPGPGINGFLFGIR